MKLTPHEEKILQIIKRHPKIIDNPEERSAIAKGMDFLKKLSQK